MNKKRSWWEPFVSQLPGVVINTPDSTSESLAGVLSLFSARLVGLVGNFVDRVDFSSGPERPVCTLAFRDTKGGQSWSMSTPDLCTTSTVEGVLLFSKDNVSGYAIVDGQTYSVRLSGGKPLASTNSFVWNVERVSYEEAIPHFSRHVQDEYLDDKKYIQGVFATFLPVFARTVALMASDMRVATIPQGDSTEGGVGLYRLESEALSFDEVTLTLEPEWDFYSFLFKGMEPMETDFAEGAISDVSPEVVPCPAVVRMCRSGSGTFVGTATVGARRHKVILVRSDGEYILRVGSYS